MVIYNALQTVLTILIKLKHTFLAKENINTRQYITEKYIL